MSRPMSGKVCLVTGATRGLGKGIALQLGEAGATVYITGRTMRNSKGLEGDLVGGCLEDTAEEIEARGGTCIPVQCDHGKEEEVAALFDRIAREQNDKLDMLVNAAYAAIYAVSKSVGIPFWKHREDLHDLINNVAFKNYYYCATRAARLMTPRKSGLIVNVSSQGGLRYIFTAPYGINKAVVDRMAADCAVELLPYNVAMISLWPGAVKTEMINLMFKSDTEVTGEEKNPERDQAKTILTEAGETPEFSGKCIVGLATDSNLMTKSGRILYTGDLGREYGLTDIDGARIDSTRSLWFLLLTLGWNRTSAITPSFLRLPHWLMTLYGSKF